MIVLYGRFGTWKLNRYLYGSETEQRSDARDYLSDCWEPISSLELSALDGFGRSVGTNNFY